MKQLDRHHHEDLEKMFGHDERIMVAYLYGSKVRGSYTPESDTDVAVLLSEVPEDVLEYYLDLADRISEALVESVDLVILNEAPPLLKHQVIKHGRLLYSRDVRARVEFEAKAEKEYLDFKVRRERYDEALMEETRRWKA
jgi:predicted nucleotidyltransferase